MRRCCVGCLTSRPIASITFGSRLRGQEFPKREFSYPDYQDYQQNNVFEGLAAYTGGGAILSGSGEPESLARRA